MGERLATALDRSREALQALALQASRVSAFHVLSGADRNSERIPWLRTRAAALSERERTAAPPVPSSPDSAAASVALADAAEALLLAAEGADQHIDGVDEAAASGPTMRLQELSRALDMVEKRLARVEALAGLTGAPG